MKEKNEKESLYSLTNIEKINQLYRLAEFGRLSYGVFHDLINPLTALSLNLNQIKNNKKIISHSRLYLNQALLATNKMEGLIASIKHQLENESYAKTFSLNNEIQETIQLLSYKARKAGVTISTTCQRDLSLYGNAIKFDQIITNLISNAIEACEATNKKKKEVLVQLISDKNQIVIKVIDNGCGIGKNINKIFKPFFSTKKDLNHGLGIGLYSTKNIIEKDFKGKIRVKLGIKTNFIISFPI